MKEPRQIEMVSPTKIMESSAPDPTVTAMPPATGLVLDDLLEILNLFFFKALTRELQCPAVLRDRANDLIRGT